MGDMVLPLLSIICAVVVYCVWRLMIWLWWKPIKQEMFLKEQGIKGPSYKLLFGNMKMVADSMREARSKPMELSHSIVPRVLPYIHQTVEKYGKLSILWYGVAPRVNIMDPEHVKDILSNKFGHFSKIKASPVLELLTSGLANYNGEKWAKHRRIINPAFHMEKLKGMLPAFHISCNELVRRWERLATKGSCELDVWHEFQNLTGDAISRTAFGSNYKQGQRIFQLQIEQTKLVMQNVQSIYVPILRFLPTKRNKKMKQIDKEVRTLLRDMINEREKAMKMGDMTNNDLLGLLMESKYKEILENETSKNAGMSMNDVIGECKLFYFAGQETTSSLLVWTMVVLSMHPNWQTRAREEVLQVFGKSEPNFDGLNHLRIVTMILHEVLRLYPPIAQITRYTYKEMKLGEITLPPGVQIGLPTLLIHHDHELWGEDAEEFKPERFLGGVSKATKNQVSFIPFGLGPRTCIGQNFAMIEAKMALVMILQHFYFELSATYVHAPCVMITLQPQHGAQIVIHKL